MPESGSKLLWPDLTSPKIAEQVIPGLIRAPHLSF